MNCKFDIAIVGGGIVGLSLALSLLNKKYTIALIDSNFASIDNKVSAVNATAKYFFEKLNIWQKITSKNSIEHILVEDAFTTYGKLEFNSQKASLAYVLNNKSIKEVLLKELKKRKNCTFFNDDLDNLIKLSTKGYKLVFEKNESFNVGFVVGADGVFSKIRQLANINSTFFNYNQSALVFNLATQLNTKNRALQKFLTKEEEVLGLLPLADNLLSLVWSCKNVNVLEYLKLTNEQLSNKVSDIFSEQFGKLTLVGDIYKYPLVERLAKEYFKDDLVLVGDAAHCIHPMAGQGLNLGLADCLQLEKNLADMLLTKKIAFRKYQSIRKSEAYIMSNFLKTVHFTFANNKCFLPKLRTFAMKGISRNNYLNDFLKFRACNSTKVL